MRGGRGFTLAEVLVALVVLAIGLTAALSASGAVTRRAADMRLQTLAYWVAQNELTRQRVEGRVPQVGTSEGEAEMGGRSWRWALTVSGTPVDGLRRMTVRVAMDSAPERYLVTATGFVGDQPRPGLRADPWVLVAPESQP